MLGIGLLTWGIIATIVSLTIFGGAAFLLATRSLRSVSIPTQLPPITVIRPIKGADPNAEDCHRSLFTGSVIPKLVLFIAESQNDPGLVAARKVCAEFPHIGKVVIAKSRDDIISGKIRNLITGWECAVTDLVAFTDSDVKLSNSDLELCLANMTDENVGVVSLPTLYDADSSFGQFSMLVMTIDNATLGRTLARYGKGGVAVGALAVVRRNAIDAIGGLKVLSNALADDVRLGRMIEATGMRAVLVDTLMLHKSRNENAVSHLLRQHRWIMSVRTEVPALFWFQLILLTPTATWFVAAVLGTLFAPTWTTILWCGFTVSVALRSFTGIFISRVLLKPFGMNLAWRAWLLPFADVFYSVLSVITLIVPVVLWRGRWFIVAPLTGRVLREIKHPFL